MQALWFASSHSGQNSIYVAVTRPRRSANRPLNPVASNSKVSNWDGNCPSGPVFRYIRAANARKILCKGETRSANRSRWPKHPAESIQADTTDSDMIPAAAGDDSFAAASHQTGLGLGKKTAGFAEQHLIPTENTLNLPETSAAAAEMIWSAVSALQPHYCAIDRLVAGNMRRVQEAFHNARIGPHHFAGSTGYGHGDFGRAALDQVMAEVMGAEAAIVRCQIVSGTHAISTALFACLRPGDKLLAVAGKPYDTLEEVIGLRGTPGHGSLMEFGIEYSELQAPADGTAIDWLALPAAVDNDVRVALVQRSCGYADRPTLTIAEIQQVVAIVKRASPDCFVVVDNCYGEFTEAVEPCAVGADLCMGSLIKSPGGTIVSTGGYIAGRADLVAASAARLTAPGVGTDAGAVSGDTLRTMFQGLFMAPQTVGEALKGGRLLAAVAFDCGIPATPPHDESTAIIPSFITQLKLGTRARMLLFCTAVQAASPVGSYVTPTPGATPGYADEVVFADGTFIDGSTAELSADGPLKPPFAVYCQGGSSWVHWAIVLEDVLLALRQADS